jgi:hypothetical protein
MSEWRSSTPNTPQLRQNHIIITTIIEPGSNQWLMRGDLPCYFELTAVLDVSGNAGSRRNTVNRDELVSSW